jgi:hypothetical protein
MVTMGKLLKIALEQQRYDLAAHILVYGLIKAKQDGKKERSKKQKSRLL